MRILICLTHANKSLKGNNSSNTKVGVSLTANKDHKIIQDEIRGRILKRPEGKINKRYAQK